jgi:NodT family efflux transporter outer membrane factor (OMF) lipoprotein
MNRACIFFPAAVLLAAGCRVPPPAPPPPAIAPAVNTPADRFKEADGWHPSQPADAVVRGPWWEVFNDSDLNEFEQQIEISSQDLKAAEARFRGARAAVGYNRSSELPTISTVPTITGTEKSNYAPNPPSPTSLNPSGDFVLPLDLSYEIDIWGRVRRVVQASQEEAQASAADMESVRLLLHAELALDYFYLRASDSQKNLLDQTVESYRQALELTTNRFNEGAAPKSDVTQAQSQLQSAMVADSDTAIQRAQYEHAIAILCGKPPSEFAIPVNVRAFVPPDVPTGLPSQLLERRPDIAAAERRVSEANERIGLAKIAYYPTLSLAALAGFEGHSLPTWINAPSRIWSVGTAVNETLFDAGRRRANSQIAVASYDAYVAAYRSTVLQAFEDVEDNLAALRVLDREAQQQRDATSAAEESLDIVTNRYREGASPYLQVLTAQTIALADERNDIDIQRRRMGATVLLIKALGGGWSESALPQLKDLR